MPERNAPAESADIPTKATFVGAPAKTKARGRKEEILSSASRMFYAKGFHATTIQDIATDVGMLKGSLYYYIKSKEDMLYEVLMGVVLRGEANIDQSIAGGGTPAEQLRRALEGQIQFIIENQVTVGVFLHEFNSLSGHRRKCVRNVMQRYQKRFDKLIRDGQEQGEFVDGDSWLLANGLLGTCNWIYRWYHGNHMPALETVQRTYIQVVLGGVLKS